MTTEFVTLPQDNQLTVKEWQILIQNWVVSACVGIWPAETRPQDIRVTIHCDVAAPQPREAATTEDIVCYDQLMQSVRSLIESQHYYLLETLCEIIATHCLQDSRIQKVFVRIEKITPLPHGACFGVELTRHRQAIV